VKAGEKSLKRSEVASATLRAAALAIFSWRSASLPGWDQTSQRESGPLFQQVAVVEAVAICVPATLELLFLRLQMQ
jgi:hypothetical protein